MRKLVIAALVLSSIAAVAEAARRGGGGGQVVHSRRAPVALHRALPPYTGVHVYQGKR